MTALAFLAFFAAGALVLYAVGDYLIGRHLIYRSLRSVRSMGSPEDVTRKELATPATSRLVGPGLRRLGRLGRRLTPAGMAERITRDLVYAGSPENLDAERVLAFKVLWGGAFAAASVLFVVLLNPGLLRSILLTGLSIPAGFLLPDMLLHSRQKRRQEAIRKALPDSLDLLSISVEAGLGFDAALARVADQVGAPLGEELLRVIHEMQLGKGRSDALRDLAARSSVSELKSFVLAMVQAEVFGISISKVLKVQARELRTKRRQRAEEQAQKVPVKIIFPLLFGIFPALLVILLGPAAIRIYESIVRRM